MSPQRFTLASLAIVAVLSLSRTAPAQPGNIGNDPVELAMAGRQLKADEVESLEEQVKADPNNLATRAKLLGYYGARQFTSQADRDALVRHVLWIIENRPASEIAGSPECRVHEPLSPEGYARARDLWLRHVDGEHKNSVSVLTNAAAFFAVGRGGKADALLERAMALEPNSAELPERLGRQYMLMMWEGDQPDATMARKALDMFERAMRLVRDADQKPVDDAAVCAAYAGELDKAKEYGRQLLDGATDSAGFGRWNYGNAVHHGNLVLGLVALRRGDVAAAEEHLRLAGRTPGSPQLNSFGPNMYLAQELLRKDRGAAVIEYLEACKKFWDRPELDKWIAAIKKGRRPDFGANLRY